MWVGDYNLVKLTYTLTQMATGKVYIIAAAVKPGGLAVFAALPGGGTSAAAAQAMIFVTRAICKGRCSAVLFQVQLEHGARESGSLGD